MNEHVDDCYNVTYCKMYIQHVIINQRL